MSASKPSTAAWIMVHLGYPLLPILIESSIRFVATDWSLTFETVNPATLAMSVGIIAAFVNQSIRGDETGLADKEENGSRNGACTLFISIAIIFFVLFGIVVLLQTLVLEKKIQALDHTLHAFEKLTYIGCSIPIITAICAQRSFKLRASLA